MEGYSEPVAAFEICSKPPIIVAAAVTFHKVATNAAQLQCADRETFLWTSMGAGWLLHPIPGSSTELANDRTINTVVSVVIPSLTACVDLTEQRCCSTSPHTWVENQSPAGSEWR